MTERTWHCRQCDQSGTSPAPIVFHLCTPPGANRTLGYRLPSREEELHNYRTRLWADKFPNRTPPTPPTQEEE